MLINIEQVRAKNALSSQAATAKKQDNEGDALSGYSSLIINNGLIAAIAFSIDKDGQHIRIVNALAFHLRDQKIVTADDAKSLLNALCHSDALTLRKATHESLEFLAYLKRFLRD